jgi:hypothetical protein
MRERAYLFLQAHPRGRILVTLLCALGIAFFTWYHIVRKSWVLLLTDIPFVLAISYMLLYAATDLIVRPAHPANTATRRHKS